ncbi:MAG: hypothetical protein FWH26_11615 [Oscillospiraceae bacterium]|nr:hypothetical protein [Oscillospiraceae bacterium]
MHHYKQGLGASADLKDVYSWGLHIQAFFFFGALAGGLLMITGFSMLTGGALAAAAPMAIAAALGCLAGGGILLVADLGRPLRSLFLIKPDGNKRSPIIWDFACFSFCGLMGLLFMFNLVPLRLTGLWAFLTAGGGFAFLMAHTHFLLTREGKLAQNPFLALGMIASSLWSAAGLLAVVFFMTTVHLGSASALLTATGIAALGTAIAAVLPAPGETPTLRAFRRPAPGAALLLVSLICMLAGCANGLIPALVGLAVLVYTFMDKQRQLRDMQAEPLLPEPFGRFERKAEYTPSKNEWLIFAGGAGVAVIAGIIAWYIMKLCY